MEVTEPNDGDQALKDRRTVEIARKREEFPDPGKLSGWEDNLAWLPNITNAHCLLYLVTKKSWSSDRVEKLENERRFLLFKSKHIQDVKLKHMLHQMMYIRGT